MGQIFATATALAFLFSLGESVYLAYYHEEIKKLPKKEAILAGVVVMGIYYFLVFNGIASLTYLVVQAVSNV